MCNVDAWGLAQKNNRQRNYSAKLQGITISLENATFSLRDGDFQGENRDSPLRMPLSPVLLGRRKIKGNYSAFC